MGKELYKRNHNFFSTDSPESFYVAGFTMADGNVFEYNEKSKTVRYHLSRKDKCLLMKIKKLFCYTGPINDYEQYDKNNNIVKTSRLEVYSLDYANDLCNRFGIIPKKTLICDFPKRLIDHAYVSHFIRGYLDGDGSWYNFTKSPHKLNLGIRGTFEFLSHVRGILGDYCGSNKNIKIEKNNGIGLLQFRGTADVVNIRDFVYKDSCPGIYLQRKYDIAFGNWEYMWKEKLKKKHEFFINGSVIRPIIGKNIKTGKIIFLKFAGDAKLYGFSPSMVRHCCNKKIKAHNCCEFNYVSNEDIVKYYLK